MIAAVDVAAAECDAEHPWRHQRAIHGDDGECYRQAVIGTQSCDRDGMRHVVIAHRIDLRGMEISSRTRITEILTVLLLIAIVFMDVEAGAASVLSGHVAIAVCPMAGRKFPRSEERRVGKECRAERWALA